VSNKDIYIYIIYTDYIPRQGTYTNKTPYTLYAA